MGNVARALYGKYDEVLEDFIEKVLVVAVAQGGLERDADEAASEDE